MAVISLRSRSHVKASIVLTRADHLCIHNYIRSLLNNSVRTMLMVRTRLEPASSACVSDDLETEQHRQLYIYIYIYIYIYTTRFGPVYVRIVENYELLLENYMI